MPKARTNHGKNKTISCPKCGKKFSSETNVLQHMNQPLGSCHGSIYKHPQDDESLDNPHASYHPSLDDQLEIDSYFPETGYSPPDSSVAGSFERDTGMELDNANDGDASMELDDAEDRQFTEYYQGCSVPYPGGSTFMDSFWRDKYSDERKGNLYFPFASGEEWQFSSWCVHSGLSMGAIDSLLSLPIIKRLSLSYRTARELRSRVESLPPGPRWLCERMHTAVPTKQPVRLFYRPALDCLQSFLSHPLLGPHISFVPRKVWTSAARICRIYEDWLSGDRAWAIQDALPPGATTLGVVLSSDKTNISVMCGNRVAYPLLISLANIDPEIRSKISLHTYLLLALLPVAKFVHKHTRIRGLLQDRLIHEALGKVLEPLKIAARVGIMMSDPVGNLRYCYTPIAAYIADTPEQGLLSCSNPKGSPLTLATSKEFGDPFLHPPRTAAHIIAAIREALQKCSPLDYSAFLKVVKTLQLNGVIEPFWLDWLLSCPSLFLHIEPLHHFFCFSWDHDVKWCIVVVTPLEIDFRFSLVQPTVGYRGFGDGISALKQVTGRDHRAIQRYIIGVIAGAVPRRFLIAIRALVDFRYLAQAPVFSDRSLEKLTEALQLFHENKDAIVQAGGRRDSWEIPKLELLQSVVPNICRSGPVTQWSADATEHAHVQEIKAPARSTNNQNYYDQIARHLDRSDKCSRFDLATSSEARYEQLSLDDDVDEQDDDVEPVESAPLPSEQTNLTRSTMDYFTLADALSRGSVPNALKPHRTFATSTTAFHLAAKPSLRMTVDEAAAHFRIPDLRPAIGEFIQRVQDRSSHPVSGVRTLDNNPPLPFDQVQIWYKVRVQNPLFHDKRSVDVPQTLRALPPSPAHSHGLYDSVIMSPGTESNWPHRGLDGHFVAQLRLIFRPLGTDYLVAYVQRFNVASQQASINNIHAGTGMHLLRRATKSNGARIGGVVPISNIRSAAHLIPNFGKEAHSRLSKQNCYEVSDEFWLNKYWSKEFYYALSSLT